MQNHKVLLVEDDLPLARMYQIVFEKNGYTVICAIDGDEGIKMVDAEQPGAVLLDLVLPKKDGFWVLAQLKGKKKLKVPIICLTVLNQKENIEKCRELGANDYLVKGDVTPDEVVARVRSMFTA